jgi:hypothetical protein
MGTAYLWLEGTLDGEAFQRVETKPYSFQPIQLAGPESAPSLEAKTNVTFTLTNNDTIAHTYAISVQVPISWRGGLDVVGDGTVTVGPGASLAFPIAIWMGPTDQAALDQPSGATGSVNVSAIEVEQGVLYASAALQITRNRPPAIVEIEENFDWVQVNSNAIVEVHVLDEQGVPVIDGTLVTLSTTRGTLPSSVATVNGHVEATFATGSQIGQALITAQANGISDTRIISITPPMLERIVLSATVASLPADGAATTPLVATVLDMNGTPQPNQQVRIGVEGGGDQVGSNPIGMVNGAEIVTGTTNAAGQFQVTFKSGTIGGPAGLRAELVVDGESREADRVEIQLIAQQPPGRLLLPFLGKQ